MTQKTIATPEEALALANVINPGGQRFGENGEFVDATFLHDTNCALVAVATAAFLQDGTEAAAFNSPSPLMTQGNYSLVRFVTNRLENEELEHYFPAENFDEKLAQLREQFPGQSFVVHGRNDQIHHWFNVTAEGKAIDIQAGLLDDDVPRGQRTESGLQRFSLMQIFPVSTTLSGADLLRDAQELHQLTSMVNLARAVMHEAGPEFTSLSEKLISPMVNAHIAEQAKLGRADSGHLENEVTADVFNAVCVRIAEALGQDFVVQSLIDKVTKKDDYGHKDLIQQSWLTDAQFREPGSTEPGPSVADVFRDRCPMLDVAMRVAEQTLSTAQPDRANEGFSRE